MANVIKCPVCGEDNLSDQEFCQYCQSRLLPLTGNAKGADEPLRPGQIPTKKITADLEPVLPQWLREARSLARQTSEDDVPQPAQQKPESSPPSTGADLLAGLQAQRQEEADEEDLPDWLTSITGEPPKEKKSRTESSEVRWVEFGGTKDFSQPEPASDVSSWLTGMAPSTPQPDEKGELTDWLPGASESQIPQKPSQPLSFDSPPSVPPAAESQDWLHSMGSDDGAFIDSGNAVDESLISSDTPDWLRALETENDVKNANAPSSGSSGAPPAFSDTPDWLRAMSAENDAQNVNPPSSGNSVTPPVSSETPDWLFATDGQEKTPGADSASFSGTGLGESEAALSSADDTPDWLKGLEAGASSSDQDWLKGFQSGESQQPAQDSAPAPAAPESAAPEQDDDALDIPSWLKAAAPQSSMFDEPPVEQEAPPSVSSSSDTSDWLNAFKTVEPPEAQAVPAFSAEAPVYSAPPAFVDDAQSSADADALFTEMPDWLSIVDDSSASESVPAPITNVDAIAPGDLPSWVQAMRPVDAGAPQLVSSSSLSDDKTFESRGALAGLQGVLPAAPGFSPTSKPKAYSIKMHASEEQQAHAALLEQILAAETAPVPIGSFSKIGTSRGLRWLLVLLFFAVLITVLFMRTQIFSMPVGLPVEVVDALQVAQSIPEGSPVLVVFDYEPARAGEIESAAAPVFDQILLLHHPRMTFISTHEMGAILAERFISGPLAGHNYQSGVQYLNLGYLPGGSMGIRAFAQNPSMTAPYALAQNSTLFNITLTPAWTLPPLQDVTSLSQFAALVLVTDNADSARAWIEQTTSERGAIPFVVVSSAQAAPMIQPYYASQQINGLVGGLYGGALFEQNNAGRPGTARAYWDAYSIGMLLAMVLILGGGLLNLALGLRDRAAAREAK